MDLALKKVVVDKLRAQMCDWESDGKPRIAKSIKLGLGEIEGAFPKGIFPLGCIHEFVLAGAEGGASTYGFIGGLLGLLCSTGQICIWIGDSKTPFPASLKMFGINPHQIIFVNVASAKDALWAAEEALKCNEIAVVVAEVAVIDLSQARRLQLASEKSGVSCFVLRHQSAAKQIPCTARWQISPMASKTVDDLPGVGFYSWKVALTKVRNGNIGQWIVYWYKGKLKLDDVFVKSKTVIHQKVG